MRFVGRAEEVVEIAHHLLISADQHHRQIVRLARFKIVNLENFLHVVQVDEFVNHAVRITGDVAQGSGVCRGSLSRWIGMIGKSWSIAQ